MESCSHLSFSLQYVGFDLSKNSVSLESRAHLWSRPPLQLKRALNVLLGSCRVSLNCAVQLDFSLDRRRRGICPAVLISMFVSPPNIPSPSRLARPRHLSAFTPSSLAACLPASVSKTFPSSYASAHQVLLISIAIIRFSPVKLVAVNASLVTAEMATALVLSHVRPVTSCHSPSVSGFLLLFRCATLCTYPLDVSALAL